MIVAGVIGGSLAATAVSLITLVLLKEERRFLFLLMLIISVFLLADNFRGPLAFSQNFRFISIGLTLLFLIKYQLQRHNKAFLILAFSIYAALVTFSLSPVGFPAVLRSVGYLVLGLAVFKLVQICCQIDRKYVVRLVMTLLLVFFVINLALFFIPVYSDLYHESRYSGLMGNPNGLGLYAMLTYALAVWVRHKESVHFPTWFFIGFKFMLIFLILVTGSRTSFLAVLAFELTIRFFEYKFLVMFGLVLLAVFSYFLTTAEVLNFINSLGINDLVRAESIETASGRTEVWEVAWEEVKRHPWLGQGMMYDTHFITEYATERFGDNYARHWSGIWNSYLSLALNVGIIGIVLFGYFWFRLFQMSTDKIFGLALLVMMLLTGITESWLAASMNAFMPLLLLIWALQIEPNFQNEEE